MFAILKRGFKIKKIPTLMVFFFFFTPYDYLIANNYFEINSGIERAYKTIHQLRLNEGQRILDSLKRSEPRNMMVYFIEDYIDFYRIFINEDFSEFKELEKNKSKRLSKIRSGDKNSPYYRFCQAEIELHWALARLKFEDYINAAVEIRNSYRLLTWNSVLHPDFIMNKKSLSAINAITGTFPNDLRKRLFSMYSGISGSVVQGARQAAEVLYFVKKNESLFRDEVYTIASFIALHLENDHNKAWNIISAARLDARKSPLACFVIANVAYNTGRNNEAIRILQNRVQSPGQLPFHYLDYMMGKALLYRLDKNADKDLLKFVRNFKGINYIKDAYLKLAWYEQLLKNNESGYRHYMNMVKSKGHTIVDEDKSAMKDAMSTDVPDIVLLRSRVLFDGAYYAEALEHLQNNSAKFTPASHDYLEYIYRKARIYQQLNKYSEALQFFQQAIRSGRRSDSYYACNSALQSGVIYEKMNDKYNAKKYYDICLAINPEEYRHSLHQKAKAGLQRIK
jgi:hypothetical protein